MTRKNFKKGNNNRKISWNFRLARLEYKSALTTGPRYRIIFSYNNNDDDDDDYVKT